MKHNQDQTQAFPYRQSELTDHYETWLLESARLNTGRYMFVDQEGEDSPYGQITAIKNSNDGWHGKFGGQKQQRQYRMSQSWVDLIFGDDAQANIIRKRDTWFKVPPGNPKLNASTVQSNVPILHPSGPLIRYPQGQLRTCMIGSFASCLYYMEETEGKTGMAEIADAIMKDHGLLSKDVLVFNKFYHIVTHYTKHQYDLFRNKEFSFEQEEELFNMPTIVVLVAKDNSTNHAITVYKDMIFDTSNEKVLSRCRQTLNWCCSTGFQKIARAYSFKEKPEHEKKQKIQRKRRRPST